MAFSAKSWARSPLGRVLLLLKQKRNTTVFLLSLILITSTLEITVPFVTQHLIDGILGAVRSHRGMAVQNLIFSQAIILVSVAVMRATRSFYNFRLFQTVSGLEDSVKSRAFENFLSLDMASH